MYKIVTYYQEDPTAIVSYRMNSRYYWAEHINYTRNAIISIVAGLGDLTAITARLMKNQEDIGDLLRPYYSTEAVDRLVVLLKDHITGALDIVKAAKAGEDLVPLQTAWQQKATLIAEFLNSVNSVNWPKMLVAPMWAEHMDLTVKQAQARLAGRWDEDIAAYDAEHKCIIDFAEVFSVGVVSQNLESFCK